MFMALPENSLVKKIKHMQTCVTWNLYGALSMISATIATAYLAAIFQNCWAWPIPFCYIVQMAAIEGEKY